MLDKVILFLFILNVTALPFQDPSKSLYSVSIQFINDYEGTTLRNFSIDSSYGNSPSDLPFELKYKDSTTLNFTTNCGQGSIYSSISFTVHSGIGSSYNAKLTVYYSSVSSEFFFPQNNEYAFILIPEELDLPNVVYSVYFGEPYSYSISSSQKQNDLELVIPENPVKLNLTICNNLNHTANLLAGSEYWGIPQIELIPITLEIDECSSFFLYSRCEGGLLGATMTYVSFGIQRGFQIVVGPGDTLRDGFHFARCFDGDEYTQIPYPSAYCLLKGE